MSENVGGEASLLKDINNLFGDKSPDEARELFTSMRLLLSYYKCAMMEVETKFRVLNEEFSLQYDRNPINAIKSRLKDGVSIREKLLRKGLPQTLDAIEENIYDIAGIRVVCSFYKDVYYLEEALLKQDDITLIRRKDYIENPKPNGYRSLHLIVAVPIFLSNQKKIMKVEVQLRTIAMDSWASMEHQLLYKKKVERLPQIDRELYKCAELCRELDGRMDMLRQIMIEEN
ncbi:MAG: GTP pyrophosphokinase family protein [Lachnospiraceae bacterium]|nr:GTP pyrophosphokinase family protein [Lachnospiraceae bacterium]